jgi:hypothetical protein
MNPRDLLTGSVSLLAALVVAVACRPPAALGQSPVCSTAEPGASLLIGGLRRLYENPAIDSAAWKQGGMPFARGSAITLVTNDSTCAAALQAYNQLGGSPVSQVYVAAVGTTGYVVRAPLPGGGSAGMTWLDSNWIFKSRTD